MEQTTDLLILILALDTLSKQLSREIFSDDFINLPREHQDTTKLLYEKALELEAGYIKQLPSDIKDEFIAELNKYMTHETEPEGFSESTEG